MCAKRLQAKNPNLLRGLGVWKLTWKHYVQPQPSLGTSEPSVQSYTWALNTTIAMLGIGTCYVSHPTPTGILRTWFQKEKLQVTKGQMPHKRVWKEEKGSLLDCCNRSYSVNNGHGTGLLQSAQVLQLSAVLTLFLLSMQHHLCRPPKPCNFWIFSIFYTCKGSAASGENVLNSVCSLGLGYILNLTLKMANWMNLRNTDDSKMKGTHQNTYKPEENLFSHWMAFLPF